MNFLLDLTKLIATKSILLRYFYFGALFIQAETLGCEGRVEEAQGVLKLCDQLKEERCALQEAAKVDLWIINLNMLSLCFLIYQILHIIPEDWTCMILHISLEDMVYAPMQIAHGFTHRV